MINLKEVEEFFLEAARQTYAADAPKTTIDDLPASKVYRYERGDWLYVDCYFSANGKSFGQTTIWHKSQPVWGMQYHGHWHNTDKRIIPFLKRALVSAYKGGVFHGGRGPVIYDEPHMTYCNIADLDNFTDFKGSEWIIDADNTTIFVHHYSGMALI